MELLKITSWMLVVLLPQTSAGSTLCPECVWVDSRDMAEMVLMVALVAVLTIGALIFCRRAGSIWPRAKQILPAFAVLQSSDSVPGGRKQLHGHFVRCMRRTGSVRKNMVSAAQLKLT
jgi:hypothetical protein